jgi:hypothetical protein
MYTPFGSPMTATHRLLSALPLAAGLTGCILTGPSDVARLETARARWEARNLRISYRFEISRSCFCGYPGALPATSVYVFGGRVLEAHHLANGNPITAEAVATIPTVDGLFNLIAEAIEEGADEVRVRYHPDTGAPLEIRIDRIRQAADDELFIETSNFGVVPINAPKSHTP